MRYENVHRKLQTVFPPEQAAVLAEVIHEAYTDLVKTSDFNELKEIVRELSVKMGELAEAQKQSETRLARLEGVVEELAEAQKRTEQRVEKLAEAQKRSEQRFEEFAKAQKETQKEVGRLDRALQELAEAQKRTEKELRKLIGEHGETRRQLGGLAATVGYRLEDEAFKALPALLERDHGLVVKGRLTRKFVNRGEDIEVNIVGQAERNGRTCTIVGESKSQLSKKLQRRGGLLF